jgi:hypothetical protein
MGMLNPVILLAISENCIVRRLTHRYSVLSSHPVFIQVPRIEILRTSLFGILGSSRQKKNWLVLFWDFH